MPLLLGRPNASSISTPSLHPSFKNFDSAFNNPEENKYVELGTEKCDSIF